ncbi:hypothetical protein BD560DRAFT_71763 [Blakeslea trispora]|nr:hypothetical protein BD560DRAFT_71754 [Blakeslea trispora]KAI8375543.1 hypothetical protein BD560DRAFT_71763 [Blakeslea trispora]
MIEQEAEAEVKALFEESKKIVFEGAAGSLELDVEKGKKQQIAFICTYIKNKFREWAAYDSSSDDEDEEDSGLKRKRKPELDESDIVQVLKEILNIVFSDTLLRWRSGERTTEATKKARKDNESSKATSTTAIKNLMGRRSDLIAYNKKKIPVCLCEVKDGMTSSASIKQESKSIRCSESLKLYNLSIGSSDHIWSLDWSRDCGYIYYLTSHEDVDVVLPGRRLSLPLVVEDVQ